MAGSGHQVLIVEDDDGVREAIERLLRAAGFEVVANGSAEGLLEESSVADASCLVSDLRLPGMSGLELLAALRDRGRRTPVILITAYDAPGRREDALRSGAAAYLVKPFQGTVLLDAIRAVIEPAETS